MRIALILSGFAPRSYKKTFKSYEKHIVEPLRHQGWTVDVYLFSFISTSRTMSTGRGDNQNTLLNMDDVYCWKEAMVATAVQENLNKKLRRHPISQKIRTCARRRGRLNACRSVYQQMRAFEMVDQVYDVGIYSSCDHFYTTPIKIDEIRQASSNANVVFVPNQPRRSWGGIENGFFVASWCTAKLLGRQYRKGPKPIHRNRENFEHLLMRYIKQCKLRTVHSSMRFLKIRAGGNIKQPNQNREESAKISKKGVLDPRKVRKLFQTTLRNLTV